MKIVDCFPYFNERELLELRINLLKDVVDEFIICDADRTHTGIPKAFTAKNTIKELGLDSYNIRVVEVNLPSVEQEPNAWVRERMQRNAAAEFISGDSVAIVGDCDEIIDPNYVQWLTNFCRDCPNNIVRIPMVFLSGRADLRVYDENGNTRPWTNAFFCMKHHCNRYTLSEMRESYSMKGNNLEFEDICLTMDDVIITAGWHFSWMGDPERLKTKYRSYMHFNDVIERSASPFDKQKQLEFIDQYIATDGSTDPLGRDNHCLKKYPHDQLPQLIFNLPRVKKFLLPNVAISVLQVGANRANDDLAKFLLENYASLKMGIFVEPNPIHIQSIEKCYNRYENILVENIAIKIPSNDQTDLTMYWCTTDGPGYEITSCNRDHVQKHMDQYSHLWGGEILSFSVPCMTLDELFKKYHIEDLDWLLLDIEGIDAEIILSFNWEDYNIKRVEFEHLHLGDNLEKIKKIFVDMGYEPVQALHHFDWAFEKK